MNGAQMYPALALAVEHPHLPFVVAGTRDGIRRHRRLDPGDGRRPKAAPQRPQRFRELRTRPRADQGHDAVALRQHPRDSKL